MRFLVAAAVSSLLFAVQPRAEDAREEANQVMREALLKQATLPASPPALPVRPPMPRPTPEKVPPQKKSPSDAAHQAARSYGMRDANAVRAGMANRAVRGGAMNARGQGTWDMGQGVWGMGSWDMMNAAWMMRWQGMNPGGGGGCCCCGMGPMGLSGTPPGGAAPGGPVMGPGAVPAPPGGAR